MKLSDKIAADLKTAMKSKDHTALRGIRAIKDELLLRKTDGSGKELTAQDEISLLQKLLKQRHDSLAIYKDQGREDLAKIEQEEIDIISRYLPEQMSEQAVADIIQDVIQTTGAESMKDMGKVMGAAREKIAGRADNKLIASIVKSQLS